MSDAEFKKLINSEKTNWLITNHPNAFLLLTLIALRARRIEGHPDGLHPGECFIGDHDSCGLTRSQYRTALEVLIKNNCVIVKETCRNRQNTTTGTTTIGTKVCLTNSDIYDINITCHSHPISHRVATGSPPGRHEQERIRKKKNIDIDQRFPKIHSSELNGAHEQFGISEGFDSMAVKATLKHLKSEDLSIGNPAPFLRKCFQNTQDALVLAKSLDGKHSEHCTIHCGPDYLEFAMNGNCAPKIIRLTDKDFMESAKETALKLGIKV